MSGLWALTVGFRVYGVYDALENVLLMEACTALKKAGALEGPQPPPAPPLQTQCSHERFFQKLIYA